MYSQHPAPDAGRVTKDFPVVIIDDHELFSTSLLIALKNWGVDASQSPVDGVSDLLVRRPHEPVGLIVLDLDLGANSDGRRVNGADLVEDLRAKGWAALIVTGSNDESSIAAAVARGAIGLVQKSSGFNVLLGAVLTAARGKPVMSAAERARWLELHKRYRARDRELTQRLSRLSPREREVLNLLAEGQRAAAIAERFVVSMTTVRTQIRSILAKAGVNSQLEAVALVRPRGVDELPR
jgi:DNA-binding NarL/FixJ family response regulator